jgi:hypothetical protein
MFARSFCRAALTAVVLASLAGCSNDPKTAVVRGKVTYKGKPVPNGTVNFIPANGPAATGEIGRDGSYRLKTFRPGDGAILGTHKVVIIAMEDVPDRPAEAGSPATPPIVPLKYTSLGTTDLQVEVKDQENIIDLDLKGDLRR